MQFLNETRTDIAGRIRVAPGSTIVRIAVVKHHGNLRIREADMVDAMTATRNGASLATIAR